MPDYDSLPHTPIEGIRVDRLQVDGRTQSQVRILRVVVDGKVGIAKLDRDAYEKLSDLLREPRQGGYYSGGYPFEFSNIVN